MSQPVSVQVLEANCVAELPALGGGEEARRSRGHAEQSRSSIPRSSMTLLALATFQATFLAPATRMTLSKAVAEAAAPLIAAGVLATTAGAVPAFANGNPSAGEVIFSGNCAACHAGGQNVIMPEKTLERQVHLAPPSGEGLPPQFRASLRSSRPPQF